MVVNKAKGGATMANLTKAKIKVVTWIGNGEERIDYEGKIDRIDCDGVVVQSIYPDTPAGCVVILGKHGKDVDCFVVSVYSLDILQVRYGHSRSEGTRPVYSANVSYGEAPKLVRVV